MTLKVCTVGFHYQCQPKKNVTIIYRKQNETETFLILLQQFHVKYSFNFIRSFILYFAQELDCVSFHS
jgi:hypothetical protein